MPSPYRDRQVAFLTRHGKQRLVREPLEKALGCRLVHTEAFDTDRLGSFTRDVARPGSQVEAARLKARMGMDLVGSSIGVASEGAFGTDPFGGLLPWNTELLLWLDDERDLEVAGVAQGPALCLHRELSSLAELQAFAEQARFPSHHLVLRPTHRDHPAVRKGLSDAQALHQAFEDCLRESENGRVFAEHDLRAFCNPTRQQMIRQAADDLVRKLQSHCPACHAPGFGVHRHVPGLPCLACGAPTRLPLRQCWRCAACGLEQERPILAAQGADPSRCDHCNP